MSDTAPKRTLVVSRHAPYGNSRARAALDCLMAAAAFEQDVSLLLLGDGVLQLLPNQSPTEGTRNHQKMIAALPLYGVETVYADSSALARHGLAAGDLPAWVATLSDTDLQNFPHQFDHILGF